MRTNGIYPPSVKPGVPKLGECPKGWKTCRFGDVLKVVERKAILEDDAEYQLVIAKRNRGGIEPRVRLRGAEIRTKTQQLITAGDFLISRRQIIHGACGLVPPSLDGALVSNEYTTLLPKDGVLLAEYLAFFSHSLHFQQTCFHSSVGVDVEKMVFRLPKWLHHKLLLPPLPEQERIAEVLGAWDRAIGLTDRLIEAKQRLKKGLMQQLLTGRLRFPQFGKPARKHGELPKGWATHEFSECAGLRREQVSPQNHEQDYICVELEHLDQNSGRLLGFTSSRMQASAKNKFQIGDILFGKLRPYLRKFWLCDRDGVCSTEAWVIKARQSRCSAEYLFYLVQDNRFVSAACITSGSKMPRADWAIVSEQPFSIPSLAEQKKIPTCLSACDREVQLLTKKRDCLQQQKKGLMQKLLTGEVRVPVEGRKHNVS